MRSVFLKLADAHMDLEVHWLKPDGNYPFQALGCQTKNQPRTEFCAERRQSGWFPYLKVVKPGNSSHLKALSPKLSALDA